MAATMITGLQFLLIANYLVLYAHSSDSRRRYSVEDRSKRYGSAQKGGGAASLASSFDYDYHTQRYGRGGGGSVVDYSGYSDATSSRSSGASQYSSGRYVNDGGGDGGHRCYSCMSKEMGQAAVWGALRRTFNQPKAFTDDCDEPFVNASRVPTRPCRTFCVTLKHAVVIMGERTNKIYFMRECSAFLAKYGFRNQTMRELDRLTSGCMERSVQSLFNVKASSSFQFQVTACPCFGDRCNSAAGLGARWLPLAGWLSVGAGAATSTLVWTLMAALLNSFATSTFVGE